MRCLGFVLLFLIASGLSAQDLPLSLVLIPGEEWKPYLDKAFPAEITSLVSDSSGAVYIALKGAKEITRIASDGKITTLAVPEPVHGLALDVDERLHATVPGSGKVLRFNKDNQAEVKEGFPQGINDLAIARNGDLYLSIAEQNTLVLIPHGDKKEAIPRKMIVGLARPTGLQLWAKDETLVVGEAEGKSLMTFRIDQDGTPVNGDRYYPLRVKPGKTAQTGGMCMDRDQRLYAATALGVQIFDPIGRLCGVVPPPREGLPVAVAWGGPDRNLLLLACGKQLFAFKTRTGPGSQQKKH